MYMTRKTPTHFSFHSGYLTDLIRVNDLQQRSAVDVGRQLEYSSEISRALGRKPQGIYVPAAALATRDLTVGTATAGGHTVATDLLDTKFIDLLRNYSVIANTNPTKLEGLVGNVSIPRQTGSASAYWVAENGAPTESQQSFDQVPLSPKTVGTFTDVSRRLLLQSSIAIDNFVKRDLLAAIGLELDRAAMAGSGSGNEPTGIINTSGISTLSLSDAVPTWDDIVNMETAATADNVDSEYCRYVITPEMKSRLKIEEINSGSGSGIRIWEGGDRPLNDYRVITSNQLPKTGGSGSGHTMIFGNFRDLLIGMWGVIDLVVDPYTHSTTGALRIAAMQDVDIAVRHPESFVVCTDAGV